MQICEENNLCQTLFQVNSQANKCTKNVTTSQVFYV